MVFVVKPEGTHERKRRTREVSAPKPNVAEAIVQCEGFRCMAVRTSDGKWVDLRGNPLKVVKVITQF